MCLPGSSMASQGPLLSLSLSATWDPVSWQQCVLGDAVQRPWVGILAAVSLASLPWGLSSGEEEQLYGTGHSAWRARGGTATEEGPLACCSFLEQGLSSQYRAWMSQASGSADPG